MQILKLPLLVGASLLLAANFPARKPDYCEATPLQTGIASVYAYELHGRQTANGEIFNHDALTAAHLTLPFGTRIKVRHPKTGRDIVVTINDRGPYVDGRVIDLSDAARRALGDTNETPGLYNVALYSCAS